MATLFKILFWGFVALCIGNSILKKINGEPENYISREQMFNNVNREIAVDSVCTPEQQFNNPDFCASESEEKYRELNKRSENYWK
jgi:hypothetical protein